MKCPVCTDKELLMTERQGIELDYCPACRGVWLDRGELDRLLEKTQVETASSRSRPYDDDEYKHRPPHYPPHPHYKHYKKKSLLSEIFDF